MQRVSKKMIVFALVGIMTHQTAFSQLVLTMEKALEISTVSSPDLKTSLFNLQRYEQNLIAQRASLKSRFALTLNPISYSNTRAFDSRFSDWYTNQNLNSSGTFSISQPIIWTDATISLNNKFGWSRSESDAGGSNKTNRAYTNDLYLSITQPLFKYNQTKMNQREIELDYENAQISYALQRLNVEKNITSQFFNVYNAQNNLEISKSELKDAEANFLIIKDKVEADMSTKDEYYQAELNLASSRSTVQNRKVSLENAKDNLKKMLGLGLAEDLTVVTEIAVDSVPIDIDMAIKNALSSRLELRQREITHEQNENSLIQVKSSDSFNGSVSLSVGVTGDNEDFQKIYDNPTQSPRISVSFTVPLFDWGQRKARIKAQTIAIESQEFQTQEEIKDIEINIRSTCRNLDNLLQQISIAKQSVNNAQLTYDLNAERYRNGELTGMEMNQFQNQLSSKKIAYTGALIDYKLELLNLKILTLYDFEKKEPIMPLSVVNKIR